MITLNGTTREIALTAIGSMAYALEHLANDLTIHPGDTDAHRAICGYIATENAAKDIPVDQAIGIARAMTKMLWTIPGVEEEWNRE